VSKRHQEDGGLPETFIVCSKIIRQFFIRKVKREMVNFDIGRNTCGAQATRRRQGTDTFPDKHYGDLR